MEFIGSHRLANKVVFTGHAGDIATVLQAADIFVLPSRSEGCSSAPVEALEAGLPCVLTRVGHAAEIIKPGVNGFLVERGDARAMAGAILQLTESESLRAGFARNAAVPPAIVTMEEYAEQIARDYEEAMRETDRHRALPSDSTGTN
jgi:glycosyltransferase involved in cell wall biosynthesis